MDFVRISARLRLGRKYGLDSSHIMQLYRAFHDGSITNVGRIQLIALQEQVAALLDLYRTLKRDPTPQQNPVFLENLERMIKMIHGLGQSADFDAALHDSSALDTAERTRLGDRMAKLAQYYKASTELILAARRKRYRIFRRIRVESFQIRVPDEVRMPSNLGSATPLVKALHASNRAPEMLRQFKGSESKASAALVRRLDGTRSGIKVHAEIKLLFYYESYPNKAKPRVICAHKSACYLCDLFLRVHGHFQVPRTFGKLNERWILPDWLDIIPPERFPILKTVIERFDSILDTQIEQLSRAKGRHSDPMESAIGISAHWSMSTLENRAKNRLSFSTVQNVSAPGELRVSSHPISRVFRTLKEVVLSCPMNIITPYFRLGIDGYPALCVCSNPSEVIVLRKSSC